MRIIRSRCMVPCHLAWAGMARACNGAGAGMQELGVCLGCLAIAAWFAVLNWPVVTGLSSVTTRVRTTVDAKVMRGMNQADGQDRQRL